MYKKVSSNSIADALSRLQTNGESPSHETEDILCYLIQQEGNPYIDDIIRGHPCYHSLVVEDDHSFEPITVDELVQEQSKDEFCIDKRKISLTTGTHRLKKMNQDYS